MGRGELVELGCGNGLAGIESADDIGSLFGDIGDFFSDVGDTLAKAAPAVLGVVGGAVGSVILPGVGTALGGALGSAVGGAVKGAAKGRVSVSVGTKAPAGDTGYRGPSGIIGPNYTSGIAIPAGLEYKPPPTAKFLYPMSIAQLVARGVPEVGELAKAGPVSVEMILAAGVTPARLVAAGMPQASVDAALAELASFAAAAAPPTPAPQQFYQSMNLTGPQAAAPAVQPGALTPVQKLAGLGAAGALAFLVWRMAK